MKSQKIGDLNVSRLAYGCMRIAGTWNPADITTANRENAHRCLTTAWESGYTLFDHADIYARGACEELHGETLRAVPSMRAEIVIATKCGVRFKDAENVGRYDFSYDHIVQSCEGSLTRLGIETIDIYQLHRPDVLMDPDEVCRAFEHLHSGGKVRHFGVSNFSPSYVDTLQNALPFKLVVNQIEVSLSHREPFFDGTLDQCLRDGITPLSWSPLGGGRLAGGEGAPDPENASLVAAMAAVGKGYGLDPAGTALAWLLKHPSKIIPIVGSAKPEKIRTAVAAEAVDISRGDWYRLHVAAQGHPMA